jgi:hypothetical protein
MRASVPRAAGELPPDGAARRRDLDEPVAEWLAIGHGATDGARPLARRRAVRLRREQRLEQGAFDRRRGLAERGRHVRRRAAQPPRRVGLEDPALGAGLLVEQQRVHRLGEIVGAQTVAGRGGVGLFSLPQAQADADGREQDEGREADLDAVMQDEAQRAGKRKRAERE